jgi:N-acetyl-alpha-D-glucosaminyl L-malate synthase BshA
MVLQPDGLRVGIVCHSGLGGSVRVAVGLASALARKGHAVHVFAKVLPLGATRPPPGVSFHGLRAPEPLHPHLHARWAPSDREAFVDLIASVVRSDALDVLHFHYALPFAEIAAGVGERLGAERPRLVMTLHGTDVSTFGADPELGRDLRSALAGLDAVTTVSNDHARLSAEAFGLDPPPEVIPNFVDVRRFRPRLVGSGPGPSPPRPARIVHISNFRRVKDPESVARIFVRIRRQIEAELWLVGDGDGMDRVRSILRAARVEDHVRSFGLRRSVHRILRRSQMLLLTSRTESFSLAALEAAACGVPVVAPRVGGLPEVVVHGRTGLLFGAGDEEEAADAARWLLADGDRRRLMGRAAATRARAFSTETIVARYERLYREVLGVEAPSRAVSVETAV